MEEYDFLDLIEDVGFKVKKKLTEGDLIYATYEFGCMMEKINKRMLDIENCCNDETHEKEDCQEFKEKLCCKCQAR